MKRLLTYLFLLFSITTFAQNKRGLAYGFHSSNDIEALTPELSWWYNWAVEPETSVADNFQNYPYEYVPMAWDKNFDENRLRDFLNNHPETKYLLGFNEPNFLEQANMTPSEAAAIWPTLEQIADEYDLELVSPAVNFCGDCVTENGTNYTSPFDYLDDFFELCTGCRVDHIAVHAYVDTIQALTWYIDQFRKYNKPIWVTEFAGWENDDDISTPEDQINYLISAVDYLESDKDVFRYAWFIGRTDNGINTFPFIDILENDGELTELGAAYIKMPTHDPETIINIPALIEAEYYTEMNGIFLEKTEDNTGFADVSFIEEDDWLTYRIKVPATSTYPINFRISSNQSSSFNILVDNVDQFTQNITDNGGFQNWSTFNNTIELTEGDHIIKLEANTSGFKINRLQIGDLTIDESNEEDNETSNENSNENIDQNLNQETLDENSNENTNENSNNENLDEDSIENTNGNSNDNNSNESINDGSNEENFEINPNGNSEESLDLNLNEENIDQDSDETNKFNIYPNPFDDDITIESPNIKFYNVIIYDITGKEIITTSFENITNINLSVLNSAIYIAVITGKEETYIRKIIKN